VRIFVAASAAAAVQEAVDRSAGLEDVDVAINAASSATLARQIEAGAPADLYLTADNRWIAYLADRGLLESSPPVSLFGNELVIAQPSDFETRIVVDPTFDIAAAFEGCLAMGDPVSVPAGLYAKQALERLGWWEVLEPRIVGAADAVAAANLIARSQCEVGILYSSDVEALDRVRIAARIPQRLHDPIEYSIVVVSGATLRKSDVLQALRSEDSRLVFADFGFLEIDQRIEAN
jgi:molybdate transport system substrate-binding protein